MMLSAPHAHEGVTIRHVMFKVNFALLPAALLGLVQFGMPAALLLLTCLGTAVVCEILCLRLNPQAPGDANDGSAILTALLLAMSLPPHAPLWLGMLGSLVAVVFGKHLYGGLGQNLFNPAMLARVALLIAFPLQMTGWALPHPLGSPGAPGFLDGLHITFGGALPDGMSGATALGNLRTELTQQRNAEEVLARSFALLPALLGNSGGSLGETSELLILLGGLWLLARRIIHWQIPLAMLLAVALPAALAHQINPARYAGALYHLSSGGLLLGALFIATDPVSSPVSRNGRLVFGAGCGLLVYVIRTWGSFPEAVAFAVLFMNALNPLIDRYWRPRAYGRTAGGQPLAIGRQTSSVKQEG